MGILKEINIKMWPEMAGFVPAMAPLQNIQENRFNNIVFDLSNIRQVTAAGLAINAVRMSKILANLSGERKWRIIYPSDKGINQLLNKLGFYEVFEMYSPERDLFWNTTTPAVTTYEYAGCRIVSPPLYNLNFSNGVDRRASIEPFVDWLLMTFTSIEKNYILNANHLILLLHEMAKNSADHTSGHAFLGLDFIYEQKPDCLKIQFSFGDLGSGINRSIADFISRDPSYKNKEAHLGLSDAYHYALGSGNTTKPESGANRGFGMAIIFDTSKRLNLHLSVFDANSRGILSLSKDKTHAELRKVFYNVGKGVGFYYFGELVLNKRR